MNRTYAMSEKKLSQAVHFSEPPPDIIQAVQVVATAPSMASMLTTAPASEYQQIISNSVAVPLNQNQNDALVLFVSGIGGSNFRRSALLRLLNQGNYNAVPVEIRKWIKVRQNGQLVDSQELIRQRTAEAELFATPIAALVQGLSGILPNFEEAYVATLNYPVEPDIKLIGFKTIRIDKDSLSEFNRFYAEQRNGIDLIRNHHYDPGSGQMRVYFPVQSAIVNMGTDRVEASQYGGLASVPNADIGAISVVGRKQTNNIRGVQSNTISDGIIRLNDPVRVDHIIRSKILVFDFGERQITDHHDHNGPALASSSPVSCMSNHGGVNCTTAFGVGQGRCPFNATVCMDYNGVFTDCVNYSSGWKKYRNFILSDCDYALGQGHCWNEV